MSFPTSLPVICVGQPEKLGFPPHVLTDGFVCYTRSEGLLLNQRDPIGVVEEALDRAISTIAKGLRSENVTDYADEFEVYWGRLSDLKLICSFFRPDDKLRKISLTKNTTNSGDILYQIFDDLQEIHSFYNVSHPSSATHINALYIPLPSQTIIIPPAPGSFWTLSDLQKVITDNLSRAQLKLLERLTRKWKTEEVIIFGLPRPSGGNALFGVLCTSIENCYPLRNGAVVQKMIPMLPIRQDRDYLLPRSGITTDFSQKRVLLIGCGSVGGFIATNLVRAGVLNLALLDPDTLRLENTFRHVLGYEYVGKQKVAALKTEITKKYPYVKLTTIGQAVEVALQSKSVVLDQFDLIIVATGNPTVNLYLNRQLYEAKKLLPTLYTWLEPYGIGGHALLTGNGGCEGCLECLYTPVAKDSVEEFLYNRGAFAAAGQSFAKSLSGCDDSFTPYGSLHAVKTATLTVELAVEQLSGEIIGNPLLSWKGSCKAFIEAGFQLSTRYNMSHAELHQYRHAYKNGNCPVCGTRHAS